MTDNEQGFAGGGISISSARNRWWLKN